MIVANIVVAVVMLSLTTVISLDSAPARRALYAVARWRRPGMSPLSWTVIENFACCFEEN